MTRRWLAVAIFGFTLYGQPAMIPVGKAFRVGGTTGLDILIREHAGKTFLAVRPAVSPVEEQVAIVRVAHRVGYISMADRPVIRYTDLIIPLLPDVRTFMAPRHDTLTFPASEIAGIQVQILAIVSESRYGDFKP